VHWTATLGRFALSARCDPEHIEKGGKVYSDALPAYKVLPAMEFVHETVNHMTEYVRGEVHINGIENFWSLLKRGLKGTYVAVEPFHLERYIDEQGVSLQQSCDEG